MKKIAYSLGLTLLYSQPVWAQETVDMPVAAEEMLQNAENNAPIDSEAAAAISQAVDNMMSDTPQPMAEISLSDEEQTIFFTEDLLEEVDEELKAPIFSKEEETTAKPKPQQIPVIPEVKIPENIKTPEVKNSPSAPAVSAVETSTQADEPATSQPIIEVEEDVLNFEEEIPETAPLISTENSSKTSADKQTLPQETKVEEKEKTVVEEVSVENVTSPEILAPVNSAEISLNSDKADNQVKDQIIPQAAPDKSSMENLKKIDDPLPQDTGSTVSVPEPQSDPAPIKEGAALPKTNAEETALSNTAVETLAEEKTENLSSADQQTEKVLQPEADAAPKAFSLDENTVSVPKPNSFSLDNSAPLPSRLLKNDALSPSILNRSIINISPEQRAKMMMKKKYDEMDSNQDGVVSEEEFVEYKTQEARKIAHQVFNQIDKNSDHMLSEYEYGILMNKMIENYIKQPQKKAN